MELKYHILFSIVPAAVIFYFNWIYGLVFFLSAVFVDIDHLFPWIHEKKSMSPAHLLREIIPWSKEKREQEIRYGKITICHMHFIEIWLIIGMLGALYSKIVLVAAVAGLYHLLLDYIEYKAHKKINNLNNKRIRIFSITYLLARKGLKDGINLLI